MINNLREKLRFKLKEVWNDNDFSYYTPLYLENEDDINRVIKYVDNKKWETPSDITAFILLVAKCREGVIEESVVRKYE